MRKKKIKCPVLKCSGNKRYRPSGGCCDQCPKQTDATVTCTGSSMKIHIPHPKHVNVAPERIVLNDPTCIATDNGTHYQFDILLKDCNTRVWRRSNSVTFSNTVTTLTPKSVDQAKANFIVEVNVFCSFDISYQQTKKLPRLVDFMGAKDPIQTSVSLVADGTTLASNEQADVATGSQIAVRVSGEKLKETNTEIRIVNCYLTPNYDQDNRIRRYLVHNRCAAHASVRMRMTGAFEQIFTFRLADSLVSKNSPTYFIHCDVDLCNAADQFTVCVQGCQRSRFYRSARHTQSSGRASFENSKEKNVKRQRVKSHVFRVI